MMEWIYTQYLSVYTQYLGYFASVLIVLTSAAALSFIREADKKGSSCFIKAFFLLSPCSVRY